MDVKDFRKRLLDLDANLSVRVRLERQQAREAILDSPRDAADDSVADESESEDYAQAESDTTLLEQVREALQRIDNGSFGQCVVDGEPIEPQRLEAVPWTPYCAKHQKLFEATSRPGKPSL